MEEERSRGRFLDYTKSLKVSFAELIVRFLRDEAPRHKSFQMQAYKLDDWLQDSGPAGEQLLQAYRSSLRAAWYSTRASRRMASTGCTVAGRCLPRRQACAWRKCCRSPLLTRPNADRFGSSKHSTSRRLLHPERASTWSHFGRESRGDRTKRQRGSTVRCLAVFYTPSVKAEDPQPLRRGRCLARSRPHQISTMVLHLGQARLRR